MIKKYFSGVKILKLKNNFKKYFNAIFRWVILLGIAYMILLPVITKLFASFMTPQDLMDQSIRWIPRSFSLENFRILFVEFDYFQALANTFILALTVSIMQVMSSILIGYGLARFKFRGSSIIFAMVILTLIVPPYMMMVPIYLDFRFFNIFGLIPGGGFNLLNSFWPLILTSITGTGMRNGLFIFVMRQFFKGLPHHLEEAAYVDGAGFLKTFYQIMLPGAAPAAVIVFLFSFVWMWSDDVLIRLFLSNGSRYAPLFLRNFWSFAWNLDPLVYSLVANAGMLLFILPLLFIYMFMQKFFVESIERTGIVG